MKKILITNHFLKDFTGSEIATFDLAKEFLDRGYNVTVGTFIFADPLKKEFDELDIRILDLNTSLSEHFDIIWAHHFTTLDTCLLDRGITADKIIFSSLSPYESLESLPLSIDKVNLLLANSEETKQTLIEMGIDNNSICTFPNPVSDNFFHKKADFHLQLKKIAIVSNHIPIEIKEIVSLLSMSNIETKIYGMEGEFKFITPEILENFDAVITIGRTAQYCLAMDIPLYCYDRFGGPGWITSSNINKSAEFNFSGRCTNRKISSEDIMNELVENFYATTLEIEFYKDFANKNYRLSSHITSVLNILQNNSIKYSNQIFKSISFRQRKYHQQLNKKDYFIQLFIDQGDGCSEENSIKLPVAHNTEFQEFIFDLTERQNIKTLRLDPLNECCVIEIESLHVKKNTEAIDLLPYVQSNAEIHHGKSYFFTTDDSQIYLSGLDESTFENAQSLVMVLRYAHIAKDALHVSVKQLRTELDNTRTELDNTKNTLSWKITKPPRMVKKTING